jgi:uncharacterized membrane protein
MNYNIIIILLITVLVLDSIYLSLIGGPLFDPMIKNIQSSKMKVNFYGASVVYVLMIIVLYYFIINEKKTPNEAFILGFCIYGIFDFTNYALFNHYELIPSIVDMVWGGILFYLTTYITYKYMNMTK